ncbi:MAG: hypothetical protein L3K09_08025, partial [Thermoplasmata archaeon]|nr:hypothetical protein [Thermoplasmata archaeon]
MDSVACSACGYVRWSASGGCPSCGADAREVLKDRPVGLVPGRSPRRNHRFIEGTYREVGVVEQSAPPSRRRFNAPRDWWVVALLAVAISALIIGEMGSLLPGFGPSHPPSAQVVIPAGTNESVRWNGTYSVVDNFTVNRPGTLQGSYHTGGDPIELIVCYQSQCGNGYYASGGLY